MTIDKVPDGPAKAEEGEMPPLPSANDPTMIKKVRGWNWGACVFTWIWLFFHDMHLWGAIVLISTLIIPCASLAASIYLGIYGNELAWRFKHFRDLEEYQKSIKSWNYIGTVILIVSTVIGVVGITIALLYLNKLMNELFPKGF